MGAWGYHIFEGDSACDGLCDINSSDNISEILGSFLNTVIENADDYIEEDDAGYALAAAAVIDSKLNGIDFSIVTEEGDEMSGLNEAVALLDTEDAQQLASKAAEAIYLIVGDNSELSELWQESEDFDIWSSGLKNMADRLNGTV